MTIVERVKAPTPKFFRLLRRIGLALLGLSGTVVAAPVVLPAALVSAAGYVAVAGSVLSAVSQLATEPTATSLQSVAANESALVPDEPLNKARDGD
jgi:hypothetical protein